MKHGIAPAAGRDHGRSIRKIPRQTSTPSLPNPVIASREDAHAVAAGQQTLDDRPPRKPHRP